MLTSQEQMFVAVPPSYEGEKGKERHRLKEARYKNEYARDLVKYFYDRGGSECDTSQQGKTAKSGKGAYLPSFTEFAHDKGVLISDIERWRRESGDFARAYDEAVECLRLLILKGVLDGSISPAAAKFYFEEWNSDAAETEDAKSFKITVSFEGEDDGDG